MKNPDMPIFSFSGEAVWPIAIAKVPVRIHEVQKMVELCNTKKIKVKKHEKYVEKHKIRQP